MPPRQKTATKTTDQLRDEWSAAHRRLEMVRRQLADAQVELRVAEEEEQRAYWAYKP